MAAVSTYLANKLLDHTLKNTAYTSPSTVYVGVYTSNPANDNSGTELSGNSYARQSMAFATASSKATSNSADVTFPTATGSWGTVTHFGVLDASSSGNLLFYGALTASKTVASGDTLKISSGDLDIAIA